MADFELVAGDQDPSLSVTLAIDGTPVNLSAASLVDRVDANLCLGGSPTVITTTITDAANGKVRLDFPAAGLTAGVYEVDWVVVYMDGHTQTFQENSSGDAYIIVVKARC
jgi:methionine-rich copper-binding protein CopC